MPEINILIMGRLIKYHGLFDLAGLIKMLDMWFKERGYNKRETKNFEEVYEDGRQVTVEFFPYKKISDNVKFEIRLFMIFSKLQDTEIEKDKNKLKLLQGDALVSMDAYLISDYENKWDRTPFYFFLRTLYDRYFQRSYISKAKEDFLDDCAKVEEEIKSYLNMFRYR
ncbi:MAG: hypothetical protein V1743_05555 [Nanoarchaeota archaeon]